MSTKTKYKKKHTAEKKNTKTTKKPKTKSNVRKKKKPAAKVGAGLDKRGKIMVAVSVILIVIIAITVVIAAQNSGKHNFLNTDKDIAYGIDVSSHNGKIDWKTVSKNVDFAFIRVGYRGYTEGELNEDKFSKKNLAEAQKAGVPVGVYIYSQAINEKEAEEEADFAAQIAKKYDVTLPIFIDCEYAYSKGGHTGRLHSAKLSKKEMTAVVNAFCKRIKKLGYTPGVYASTYFYESVFDSKNITHDAFIWLADYNKKVTYDGDYDIWQKTEKGSCDGVSSKYVDIDYWYQKK